MCKFCDKMKRVVSGKEPYVTRELEADERYECTADLHVGARNGDIYTGFIGAYGPYKLNFCPECGANIKRRLRQWKNNEA